MKLQLRIIFKQFVVVFLALLVGSSGGVFWRVVSLMMCDGTITAIALQMCYGT